MAGHQVHYVMIGGGLASATAAETIRKYDTSRSICIIGAEQREPYNRPPLSKEYLRGEAEPKDVVIHPTEWYAENGIELRLGSRAVRLDTASRTVGLEDGDTVSYEKLLLATGATPVVPNLPGASGPGVRLLRTWDDCDAIKSHLGKRIILIGGGYIGVEVAASFAQKGGQAVIVEHNRQLWNRFASPEFAAYLKSKLESAGVEVRLSEEVTAITDNGVVMKTGEEIAGDLVLVAVGVRPNVELAKQGALAIDEKTGGILVNEYLETTATGVWAAGDAASFYDPVLGKRWRVEHWNNAQWHGEIAGANMAGQRTAYDHVANFFSDELDIHFELFGDAEGGRGGLFHGDPASDRFDELYVNPAGQVVMVISINPPDDLFEVLEQIPRRKPMVKGCEDEVSKPEYNLKHLLAP
jgi:3-phenylpropionate/trans-cinnamate dioxygenase ferredoxin reductase subunit